jgi:hypothetical protein
MPNKFVTYETELGPLTAWKSTDDQFFPNATKEQVSSMLTAAIEEHERFHKSDGCSLFVIASIMEDPSDQPLIMTYPVSARSLGEAFAVVCADHKANKRPEPCEWALLFSYPASCAEAN